jgi:hypothetical protein
MGGTYSTNGEIINELKRLVGDPERKNYLRDRGVNWRIILIGILKKWM